MRELFRERDFTRVGYYQSILEANEIPTHVRNEHVATMVLEVPIPDLYPALCVVNDEDYDRAMTILREAREPVSPQEETLPPRPMPLVVYLGALLIFGGKGLGLLIYGLASLDETRASFLYLLGSVVCFWIVGITIKRFLTERQPASHGVC